jgi:hypothetical protein
MRDETTGINDVEVLAIPIALTIDTVTGYPAEVIYNGLLLPYQTVKKGTLTHIWPAYYRYGETHYYLLFID